MPMLRLNSTLLQIVVLFSSQSLAAAELSWPCRNGPLHTGCAAERDARGVPVHWDEPSGKNVGHGRKLDRPLRGERFQRGAGAAAAAANESNFDRIVLGGVTSRGNGARQRSSGQRGARAFQEIAA